VVEYMLHTLIHLALTKPSNLLLRGKRGRVPVFAHQGRGKISQLLAAGKKFKRGTPDLPCCVIFSPVPKRGPRFSTSRIYGCYCLRKNKNFCKIAKRRKEI